MKFLIVGRSGTGKDTLAGELEKAHGLKPLKSYATRPKRTPDEDTHVFITPEEAVADTDRAAETVINGYEYFSTKEQVRECDTYIIDPNGLYQLVKNMPDTEFAVVYLFADEEKAKRRGMERAENPETEAKVIRQRMINEDAQFTDFEERYVSGKEMIADNCCLHLKYENNHDIQDLRDYAAELARMHRKAKNLLKLTEALKADKCLVTDEDGTILVWHKDESKPVPFRTEQFALSLICDEEGLGYCMSQYLALHDI